MEMESLIYLQKAFDDNLKIANFQSKDWCALGCLFDCMIIAEKS